MATKAIAIQPAENEIILICDLGASAGYERVERVFNTPRLKSQIRIISFSAGVYLPAANQSLRPASKAPNPVVASPSSL